MGINEIISAIFLIAVLILVLPGFLISNSKIELFIKNLFIWSIIIASIMVASYFIFK